jgi:hypothetical protein
MLSPLAPLALEHLTPHDLVTYFRCPHEMELTRLHRPHVAGLATGPVRTPADVVPLHRSPMFPPPIGRPVVNEGRLDVLPRERLVYEDPGEGDDLPVLFPPEQVHLDPRYTAGHTTLVDPEWGLAGRPDFVIQREDGGFVPLEYKETHLFVGYHEAHGRVFDTVQAIAECRLVEVAFGRAPSFGIVLYGDAAGDGQREGWVEVPYGAAERQWLKVALAQVRADGIRAPVPAERNCAGCEPNSAGLCRYAAARPDGRGPTVP